MFSFVRTAPSWINDSCALIRIIVPHAEIMLTFLLFFFLTHTQFPKIINFNFIFALPEYA